MDASRRIDDLADELISDILSFILGSELFSPDNSPTNSHDTIRGPNGSSSVDAYGEKTELDRFRLVCRRFMRIGTPRKFPRFVLRFSRDGFRRLEELLTMQLACHVRHFTYMVRPFYQGSGWSHVLNGVDSDDLASAHIHKHRLQDQRHIIDGNHDLRLLRRAIAAFPSLQQVKLLRLQDEADEQLDQHIQERALGKTIHLDWEPACTRAVTSLGVSLLESQCTSVRFVGPQISPEATVRLLQTPATTLSALGARLTSLDVTFHATRDVTPSMETLSTVFYDFFLAAKNLTAIHLGFPANIPLDLSLERIFHRIQWKRLQTLSLQGWRLNSEELIALIRRHRRQLRDIRLTSIYLRPSGGGGRWSDILSVLHDEMDLLENLDLHEINYALDLDADTHNHYNYHHNSTATNGNTTLDVPMVSIIAQPALRPPPRHPVLNIDYLPFGPRGNTRRSFLDTELEELRALTIENLGDNGVSVRSDQWRFWQGWVLSSPRHTIRRRV